MRPLPEAPIKQKLLDNRAKVLQDLPLRVIKGAQFIWDKTLDDAEKGWGEEPVRAAVLDERFGKEQWTMCPTFCIEQTSGNLSWIADANRGYAQCS